MQDQIYKKFSLIIILSVCLSFFLSIVWLFTGYFAPNNDSVWVNNLYRVKEVYAAVVKGPKIVIVAGSSGFYGVSGARIQHHFRIPTVNMATHGGLRDYYLHKAKKNLNPGDFVILAPEYTLYFSDAPMSVVKSDYIINFDKTYLKSLPFEEQQLVVKTCAHPWQIIKNEVNQCCREYCNGVEFEEVCRSININGDATNNFGVKKHSIPPVRIPYKFNPDNFLFRKVSDFIKWCEKENIIVVVSWPGILPVTGKSIPTKLSSLDAIKVFLYELSVECLGEPEDFFVKHSDLYNTAYHLNQTGVEHRTARLIGLLETSPSFNGWERKYQNRLKSHPAAKAKK